MRTYVALTSLLLTPTIVFSAPAVFAEDTSSVTIPIQMHGTYLYVDLQINDKPATFVIDSGAGVNIVTPDAATRLGLVAGKEQVNAVGAGGAGGAMSQTKIDRLRIGSQELKDQNAYILPLPEALASDGLLGTPFLRAFAVTIDYERHQLTMTPPKNFKAPKDASAFPIRFKGFTPFIEAKANEQSGWYRIDTGAGNAVTLFSTFVEKAKLRSSTEPAMRMPLGRGVGGLVYGEMARLKEFSLGQFRWERPITEYSQQKDGAFSDSENAGNLGGDLWQRFTVTLDYTNNKVYLQPNALYDTEFRTPRSGIAVDTANGLRTVINVMPNSPGSEAGVREGDVLVAVNDTLIEKIPSWDLSAMLRDKPGTKLRLRLRAADKTEREATITLRDLL